MKTILLVSALALGLAGCETIPEGPVAVPDEKTEVKVDKELLKGCAEPSALASGKDADNLKFTEENLAALAECSSRQKGLANLVKKAFNIKD